MRKETRALAAMLAPMGAEESIPLAPHTSFRIGGPADLLFAPKSREELCFALEQAKALDVPVTLMGNGTNLLVRDGGVEGLVLKLGPWVFHYTSLRGRPHTCLGRRLAQQPGQLCGGPGVDGPGMGGGHPRHRRRGLGHECGGVWRGDQGRIDQHRILGHGDGGDDRSAPGGRGTGIPGERLFLAPADRPKRHGFPGPG